VGNQAKVFGGESVGGCRSLVEFISNLTTTMNTEAETAVRHCLREFGIVIQPPGWMHVETFKRYEIIIQAFAGKLDLSLDEPILDLFVVALDELPENQGISHYLAETGLGAWFLSEFDEVRFYPEYYKQYRAMIQLSEVVDSESGALRSKPVLSALIAYRLRNCPRF
jgi:hypothetical protein